MIGIEIEDVIEVVFVFFPTLVDIRFVETGVPRLNNVSTPPFAWIVPDELSEALP